MPHLRSFVRACCLLALGFAVTGCGSNGAAGAAAPVSGAAPELSAEGLVAGMAGVPFSLEVQSGHTGEIRSTSLSPDGHLAATGDENGNVLIWDVGTGRIVRRLQLGDKLRKVVIGADGKTIAAIGKNTVARWPMAAKGARESIRVGSAALLWKLADLSLSGDGKHLAFQTPLGAVNSWPPGSDDWRSVTRYDEDYEDERNDVCFEDRMVLSQHGDFVITSDGGKPCFNEAGRKPANLWRWDLPEGKSRWTVEIDDKPLTALAVSRDDKLILTGTEAGAVKLSSAEAVEQLGFFHLPGRIVGAGFSAHDRRVLAASIDSAEHVVFATLPVEKVIAGPTSLEAADAKVAVHVLPRNAENVDVVFAASAPRAFVTYSDQAVVMDLDAGRMVQSFPLRRSTDQARMVALAPDGHTLVAADERRLRVMDLAMESSPHRLPHRFDSFGSATFCAKGDLLVTTDRSGGAVKLWSTQRKEALRTFEPKNPGSYMAAVRIATFTPDCTQVVALSGVGEVDVWQTVTGERVRNFSLSPTSYAVMQTDARLSNHILRRHDPGEWLLSPLFNGGLTTGLKGKLDVPGDEARSKDGHVVVRLTAKHTLESFIDGYAAGTWMVMDIPYAIAIRKDARTLVYSTGLLSRTVDLESGRELSQKAFPVKTFGPDAKTGIRVANGAIELVDIASEEPLKRLAGITNLVSSSIAATGDRAVLATDDGVIRLWDFASGNVLSLVTSGDDWIVYTPDGLFDASRTGGSLVAVVQGDDAYGIDQFATRTNRPDLIFRRFGLGNQERIRQYEAQVVRRMRKLGVDAARTGTIHVPTAKILEASQRGRTVSLRAELSDPTEELRRYNVYVNDVPLFGPSGKSLTGHAASITETVELAPGNNKIEIGCVNAAGAESIRAMHLVPYDPASDAEPVAGRDPRGEIYFVGFGVSRYRNPKHDLFYAHKDILDLAEVFKAMHDEHGVKVHVKTFVNEEVTVENVRKAVELLKPARVEDTAVLVVAGHGSYGADAEYHYGTHEMDLARLPETSVPFALFERLLQDIAPRRKLFLMDTCESGERDEEPSTIAAAEGGKENRARGLRVRGKRDARQGGAKEAKAPRSSGPQRERYIFNDITRRTGAVVLSSSRGDETSREEEELENGVFTEELLKALTTDVADADGNGVVSVHELRRYVVEAVAEFTHGAQNPSVDRDNLELALSFPIVTKAHHVVTRGDPLPSTGKLLDVSPGHFSSPNPHACGCRAVAPEPGAQALAGLALAAALAWRRARRRPAPAPAPRPGPGRA